MTAPKTTTVRERIKEAIGNVYEDVSKTEKLQRVDQLGNSNKRSISRIRTLNILSMLNQGYTHLEIRTKFKMDSARYSYFHERINKLIRKEQSHKIEELVGQTMMRHQYVYRNACTEFEKSKYDSKGNRKPGSAILLQVMNESLRDLRKLLGLDRTADIINNGNMAIFQWDSLTNPAQNQNVDNGVVPALESKVIQVSANVDPIESRIRELERLANELNESEFLSSLSQEYPKKVETETSNSSSAHNTTTNGKTKRLIIKPKIKKEVIEVSDSSLSFMD
jgi:hypothetical protein